MADKRIQDLTPASSVQTSDRFVLEQSGQAKSLTGQILINDLAAFLDGHGGINDISYTPPSTGSLDGTLTITLADETVETFTVTNGRGIASIGYVESIGLDDYYQIDYNDDSEPTTFVVHNGEKGDTGDDWYVHIKWAAVMPTQDSDMVNYPDDFIGIYSGISSTAPTSYGEYDWYEYKGEKGDTGTGITGVALESSSGLVDTYRVSFDDGTSTTFNVTNGSQIDSITKTSSFGLTDIYAVTLTNGNQTTFQVNNGKSIVSITWTSTTSPTGIPHIPGATDTYTIVYNDGDSTTFQVYNGLDGEGASLSVDGILSINGDVPLLTIDTEHGAPSPLTVGSPKSRYFDAINSVLYICMGYDENVGYIWRGAGVTVDSALSTSSTNPVQNRIITNKIGTAALDTTAQDLSGAVNEILDDISGFADNLADEYDATVTHAVGDYCIHDNTLYRCNTAISTPEAWNSIHWTAVALANDVNDISNGKVSKSGDTMTSHLQLKSTAFQDNVPPSSGTTWGSELQYRDKVGALLGSLHIIARVNGDQGLGFTARRRLNGEDKDNALELLTASDGTRKVNVSDSAVWRSTLNVVNRAGDTMTGNLTLENAAPGVYAKATDVTDGTAPSSDTNQIGYRVTDKNGANIAIFTDRENTNGTQGAWVGGGRNGTYNNLYLLLDSSGNRVVSFSEVGPWRKALGLGNASTGALPILMSQGGTSATGTSKTTTASSIITAASGVTVLGAQYVVWGKLASVFLDLKCSSAIGTGGKTIGTLASGKRPAIECAGTVQAPISTSSVSLNPDGTVIVRATISANAEFWVVGTYILA